MKLRTKLVALSLLTLLLPWSGWKLLQELERFLREAHEGALLGSARTLAGALPVGFVRVGPLMNLPALVSDLGGDPGAVFSRAGFDLATFAEPDTGIPFVAASRLLADSVAATGCEHLGLLLGERCTPSSLGIAGFILSAAPDVGTALRGLVQHLDMHDRGGAATLV